MLAEINHLLCKGIYFLLYTWREIGREPEISRAVGWTFCLNGNKFLFKCHRLLHSVPPLKDTG